MSFIEFEPPGARGRGPGRLRSTTLLTPNTTNPQLPHPTTYWRAKAKGQDRGSDDGIRRGRNVDRRAGCDWSQPPMNGSQPIRDGKKLELEVSVGVQMHKKHGKNKLVWVMSIGTGYDKQGERESGG